MRRMLRGTTAGVIGLAALVTLGAAGLIAQPGPVTHRIVDTGKRGFTDFNAMVADAARADVLFLGERRGNPNTHRFELAVLEELARRQRDVILGLEVFDRRAQEPLDHFQMGHLSESDFLGAARPSAGDASDYKPLVDLATRRTWTVIATRAPAEIADEVSRHGLEALQRLPDEQRRLAAREVQCPIDDADFERFRHASDRSGAEAASNPDRAYLGHCVDNETIAESMAQVSIAAATGGKRPLLVSVNDALRSDFGGGVVARARRRLPDKRLVVVSIVPVTSLETVAADSPPPHRGDYIVYVLER